VLHARTVRTWLYMRSQTLEQQTYATLFSALERVIAYCLLIKIHRQCNIGNKLDRAVPLSERRRWPCSGAWTPHAEAKSPVVSH